VEDSLELLMRGEERERNTWRLIWQNTRTRTRWQWRCAQYLKNWQLFVLKERKCVKK